MENYHIFLTLFGFILLATIGRCQEQTSLDENIKELLSRRKGMDYVRQIVEDMDNQLNRLQKRTCYFNAGVSSACDDRNLHKDTKTEMSWKSQDSPGKRSSYDNNTPFDINRFLSKRSCLLRLPGMDCDFGDITGNAKDQSFWVGDDSPGKKRSYHQYSCEFKVGNPEGCLGKLVDGDKKDNSHWGDPDGPGKK